MLLPLYLYISISLYLHISISLYLFFFNFLIFSSFISFLFSFSSIFSPLLSFSHNSEAFHLTSACQLRSPPSLPPSPPGPAGALARGLGEVFGPRFCPPFSRYGRRLFASFVGAAGCFGLQSQKRGISNSPGKPEFRQRSQNSSRSDFQSAAARQTGC